MRALLAGERNASPGVVLGIVAVIAALVASLALTLAYRGQLIDLKKVIYGRCQQRAAYDTAGHLSVGADVQRDKSQLALDRQNKPAVRSLIHSFPRTERAGLRATEAASVAATRRDLIVKRKAYALGVIGSCQDFK